MSLFCAKCNTALPEHEGLQYRFCPLCGAEIKPVKKETNESYQTIPPDLAAAFEKTIDDKPVPDEDKKDIISPVSQTLAPDFTHQRKTRLEIKPPSSLPPSSFYRITAVEQELSSEKNKQKQIGKHRWGLFLLVLIMVILVVLAYRKFF